MKNIMKILVFIASIFVYTTNVYARENIQIQAEISNVTNNVTNTFTYNIESFDTNPTGATNEPKTINLKLDNVSPDTNNKVNGIINIDFSNTNYTKTGDYYYKITEAASSNESTFPISKQEYTIIVRVSKTNDVMSKNVISQAIDYNFEKSDIVFTHNALFSYITIEAYADGIAQNLDQYFKYKISIYGNVGDRYYIHGQDSIVYFEDKKIYTTNYYEVKPGDDNYVYIYLKRNQKVTIGLICPECIEGSINQIMVGTKYSIEKISANNWNTTVNNDKELNYLELTVGENPDDNVLIINNEKSLDLVFDRLFLNYFPFIILIIFAVIGIIIIKYLNKRNDDDKDDNS